MSEPLPGEITQVQSQHYKNGSQLPPGEVLVVGSGQSGAQIAEDLHLEGRKVHLVVGGAPRVARFYRGRDVTDWLAEMGYYDMPVTEHPRREAVRAQANHYVTGRDGGRDIDLRAHAAEGMSLYGLMHDHRDGVLHFKPDLTERLDHADEVVRVDQGHDRQVHRRPPPRRPGRGALHPGLAPRRGDHRTAPSPTPASPRWSGASASARTSAGSTCRSSPVAAPPSTPAASPPRPACTSSACPGSGPGAPGRFSGVGRDAEYLAERIRSQRGLTTTGGRGDVCNVLALGS